MAQGLIARGMRQKSLKGVMLLGVELNDAREEVFVRMVCDGLALGIAYSRAGFTSKAKNAAALLFNLPRVQERASKILEARRVTGVVTLPQVTDMLQRVFAGAHSEGEYSAAHNAAFSLARLYGHVTDKSVIEHIRRPSRDPDAPSEQALEAWAASLPVVSPDPQDAQIAPFQGPPAPLLGPGPQPSDMLTTQPEIEWLNRSEQGPGPADGRPQIGNGAPVGPVTGTPHTRGRAPLLKNGSPSADEGTGADMGENSSKRESSPTVNEARTEWPDIKDLF